MSKFNPRTIGVFTALFVLLTGCGVPATPNPPLSVAELKYQLIDRFGGLGIDHGIHWCDPNTYDWGTQRPSQAEVESKIFPSITLDSETFHAILNHLNLNGTTDFTSDQKWHIWLEYHTLSYFGLYPTPSAYQFHFFQSNTAGRFEITGTIDQQGIVTIQSQRPAKITDFGCSMCGDAD